MTLQMADTLLGQLQYRKQKLPGRCLRKDLSWTEVRRPQCITGTQPGKELQLLDPASFLCSRMGIYCCYPLLSSGNNGVHEAKASSRLPNTSYRADGQIALPLQCAGLSLLHHQSWQAVEELRDTHLKDNSMSHIGALPDSTDPLSSVC